MHGVNVGLYFVMVLVLLAWAVSARVCLSGREGGREGGRGGVMYLGTLCKAPLVREDGAGILHGFYSVIFMIYISEKPIFIYSFIYSFIHLFIYLFIY